MPDRWFPTAGVASPHHLATAAGSAVLAAGGNAMDAAVAANLVLGVVTPHHCGLGGDLVAIVWDGQATGVLSTGAAPSGATPEAIRVAVGEHGGPSLPGTAGMPAFGELSVTVPGAIAGWFHLLQRWGTRSFGELASAARRLAADGFLVSPLGAGYVEDARADLSTYPEWAAHYGRMQVGERFVQPALAATFDRLGDAGPDAFYRGPLAEAIVERLAAGGSTMTTDDLAGHRVLEVEPLAGTFRDVEVLELPPPMQGVTALTILGLLDALGPLPRDEGAAAHLGVEAVRLALADRARFLTDPAAMRTTAASLLDPARLRDLAATIDPGRRLDPLPVRPALGGTAYLCAADGDGLLVSLMQSNFLGFGSGVVIEEAGIGLHDRGAYFSLDPADANVIAPGKRSMHTLVPALALRDGAPWLVFGTMGADAQPQIQAQLLTRLLAHDGSGGAADAQTALDAPRWVVDAGDGTVAVESRAPHVIEVLRDRGHVVEEMAAYAGRAGHAHVLRVLPSGGYAGGFDPRSEGAIAGL